MGILAAYPTQRELPLSNWVRFKKPPGAGPPPHADSGAFAMRDLYRLIYTSRNQMPGSEAAMAEAVAQILEISRRTNVRADVTGAAIVNGGAFAQVLEGPRRCVVQTFERIQRDMRHGD